MFTGIRRKTKPFRNEPAKGPPFIRVRENGSSLIRISDAVFGACSSQYHWQNFLRKFIAAIPDRQASWLRVIIRMRLLRIKNSNDLCIQTSLYTVTGSLRILT